MTDRTDFPSHDPADDDRDVIAVLDRAGLAPTDTFRASLLAELETIAAGGEVTTLRSAAERRRDRNRMPLLLAAAAAIVVVVAIVAVGGRNDTTLDPADTTVPDGDVITPLPPPDAETLTGADLFAELENRRWLALERFDVAVPTALTSRVVVSGTIDDAMLTGHDGCNRYGGRFTFDGATVTTEGTAVPSDGFESEAQDCGVDTLQLAIGDRIELAAGADDFLLRSQNGDAVARFADEQSIPLSTPDDLVGTWLFDDGSQFDFRLGGSGGSLCVPITWTEGAGRITVELQDADRPTCGPDVFTELEPAAAIGTIRELIATRPEVRTAPDGLVLTNGTSAVTLRRPPTVDADPTGVTLAAGAIYGIDPGLGVTPETVLTTVEAQLGDPDLDTGWLEDLNDGQMASCELDDFRIIAWGDLEFVFWGTGGRTLLLAWVVGDRDLFVSNRIPDIDRSLGEPTGLRTEQGVGIGDSADVVPESFGVTRSEFDGETRIGVSSINPDANGRQELPLRGGSYVVVDDTIVGFGSETFTC